MSSMEYACPVWHFVTVKQSRTLESLQKGLNIIFPDMDYKMSMIVACIDTLQVRREALTKRFFRRSVMQESSCLHYLLPEKRDSDILDKLRHPRILQSISIKTAKFNNSFLPYCLKHYAWTEIRHSILLYFSFSSSLIVFIVWPCNFYRFYPASGCNTK